MRRRFEAEQDSNAAAKYAAKYVAKYEAKYEAKTLVVEMSDMYCSASA